MESQDDLLHTFSRPPRADGQPIDKEKLKNDIIGLLQASSSQQTTETRRTHLQHGLLRITSEQSTQRHGGSAPTVAPALTFESASPTYVGIGVSFQQQHRRDVTTLWECHACVVVRTVSSDTADAPVQTCSPALYTAHDSSWSDGGGVFAKGIGKGMLRVTHVCESFVQ
jgi:hypothetical protein